MGVPNHELAKRLKLGYLVASFLKARKLSRATPENSDELLNAVIVHQEEAHLIEGCQRLQDLPTLRYVVSRLTKLKEDTQAASSSSLLLRESEVLWGPIRLGKLLRLFREIIPQEVQTRLAYETFIFRFLTWLEQNRGVIALEITDFAIMLFEPEGESALDIDREWQRFVANAFSTPELQRTLVLLLNSIRLSDRGFSVPEVPLVTIDQADVLVAFVCAAMMARKFGLRTLERKIKALEASPLEEQSPTGCATSY